MGCSTLLIRQSIVKNDSGGLQAGTETELGKIPWYKTEVQHAKLELRIPKLFICTECV